MDKTPDIRGLYIPVQPTVKQSAEHVTYREFLPETALQGIIYCYWRLRTTQPLDEPFFYRVVADGCIDIFFELNNPRENFVMGFCKKYTEFPLENSFDYVGVRFLPTMLPQLFKVNAAGLSNRFENLDVVIPRTARFIASDFGPDLPEKDIKARFDRYFLKLLQSAEFDHDPRLYGALAIILQNFGVLNVEKDLDTGLSPRQLRRLFEFYIGDSAKTFSQVVRFQNILRAKPSQQSLRENKLFYDNGYYDQAHFIKEFKNLYGVTPGKAFGR
ncbi:AraC family transcriptional regulator [Dyadobacter fermentans]|uniref:Transcriptional regulator, AraC family n=1 Tax=Dyadobacter fermentans (strain ATCC 700827 / DSM 18053 / CIP 107007 / KCTC 52180 / NS114) TaxID=471854 RepID=C6VW53_DYAFD|nr:helix-turn-helix domain-containing protein [Dyadobacter fermentans]ACT93185.1 transcriptional regulator, AraC family [Dyadobacter fermentans DSM 18053]